LYERFKRVAEREGRSPSEVIRELIREYVHRHELGNPQLRLDKILAGEPQPGQPPKCKFCERPATHVQFWVHSQDWTEVVYVCDLHRSRATQAPLEGLGERRL